MRRLAPWVALLCGCAAGAPGSSIRLADADASVDVDGSASLCGAGECQPVGAGICGDDYLEPGPAPAREACDDGNLLDGDACDSGCAPTAITVVEASATESLAPALATAAHGALIAWAARDASGTAIRALRLTDRGLRLDASPLLVARLAGDPGDAHVRAAALHDGYAIVWTAPDVSADQLVMVAVVDAYGRVRTQQVSPTDRGAQREPVIAPNGRDAVVVAWLEEANADDVGQPIVARARVLTRREVPGDVPRLVAGPILDLSDPSRAAGELDVAGWTDRPQWAAFYALAPRDVGARIQDTMLARFDEGRRLDGANGVRVATNELRNTITALRNGTYAIAQTYAEGVDTSVDLCRAPATGAFTTCPSWESILSRTSLDRVVLAPTILGDIVGLWDHTSPGRGVGAAVLSGAPIAEIDDLTQLLGGDRDPTDVAAARGSRAVWVTWSERGSAGARRIRTYLLPYADPCRECAGETPYCDETQAICVGCRSGADCPIEAPLCDPAGSRSCVECIGTSDCESAPNRHRSCMTGVCDYECIDGYSDCTDGAGCETFSFKDDANCGGCGIACPPGAHCTANECRCDPPYLMCNGACVDPRTDPTNCGGCGVTCGDNSACTSSSCACLAGFDACSGECVSLPDDDQHCGACGHDCDAQPGITSSYCYDWHCRATCAPGRATCDDLGDNGCEVVLATDVANCGSCNRDCRLYPNVASATCAAGDCSFTCTAPRADCDGLDGNGCETNTSTSMAHCGGCGIACSPWQYCNGSCINLTPTISTNATTYASGTPVVVSWTNFPGTTTSDVVAITTLGAPVGTTMVSYAPGTTTNGSWTMSLILPPASYEVRMIVGGTVRTMRSFTVTGAAAVVTPIAPLFAGGSSVQVNYSNVGTLAGRRLVIAPEGSSNSTVTMEAALTGGTGGARVFVGIPAGRYVARLYIGTGGSVRFSQSDPFTVSGVGQPAIVTALPTYAAGSNTVTVYWVNLTPHSTDRIAIAEPAFSATRYWIRMNSTGTASGNVSFASLRLPPGTYVARAYDQGTTTLEATSPTFTVTGTAASMGVTLSVASVVAPMTSFSVGFGGFFPSTTDWISVAPVGMADTTYSQLRWSPGTLSGTVTFSGLPAGDYEVRGYFNWGTTQSYVPVIRRTFRVGS